MARHETPERGSHQRLDPSCPEPRSVHPHYISCSFMAISTDARRVSGGWIPPAIAGKRVPSGAMDRERAPTPRPVRPGSARVRFVARHRVVTSRITAENSSDPDQLVGRPAKPAVRARSATDERILRSCGGAHAPAPMARAAQLGSPQDLRKTARRCLLSHRSRRGGPPCLGGCRGGVRTSGPTVAGGSQDRKPVARRSACRGSGSMSIFTVVRVSKMRRVRYA